MNTITLSERAHAHVESLLQQSDPGLKLRVYIQGGGCSGLQYGFKLDGDIADDDLVIEQGAVAMIVDERSMQLLGGSTVDYVQDLKGSYFKIDNPNAAESCSCGASFCP